MNSNTLKELRDRLDFTPTELAAALGVSARTVQNWEAGAYPIPKPIQKLIKEYWGNGQKTASQ